MVIYKLFLNYFKYLDGSQEEKIVSYKILLILIFISS